MTEHTSGAATAASRTPPVSPWAALWVTIIGLFMILMDTTIVTVANPAMKASLDPTSADLDSIVWVMSAYLLAFAVPLLITGRLGDRFGVKNIYLVGLTVFTLASLACGLSSSLGILIVFRVVQGAGAALLTPQTMALITRTFPPHKRGAAMGIWGAVAGVATLVGPLAGGLLVDSLGWEWIFFVNLPIGAIGLVLAIGVVPTLHRHEHRLDLLGMLLSASAMFLVVFGLQEGNGRAWDGWTWVLVGAGVALFGVFLRQQATTRNDPLLPLGLFHDRSFWIANVGIALVSFTVTSMAVPLMFYVQLARGLLPTEAALLMTPMAVVSGVLAPFAGHLVDRLDPRIVLIPAFVIFAGSLVWIAALTDTETRIWVFAIPSAVMGIGNAGLWGPLATTATRTLPPHQAGAGSGIYNTTQRVGAVLGSAAIAAFMQARLGANITTAPEPAGTPSILSGTLPDIVAAPFSTAMAQTLLLPAAVMFLGAMLTMLLSRTAPPESSDNESAGVATPTRNAGSGRTPPRAHAPGR